MLNLKTFYKSQKDLAHSLNTIIDKYYCNEIDETSFKNLIISILKSNESKVFKNNNFTSIITQRCGKRRVELLQKIVNDKDRGGTFEKLI